MRRSTHLAPAVVWSVAVLVGVVASLLTLGYSYTYCLDGPGFGLPFAIIRPAHGDAVAAVFIGERDRVPSEVSTLGLAGDLVIWSGLAGLTLILAGRIRRRRQPSGKKVNYALQGKRQE